VAVSVEQAHELALGLPEAVEQDHHGRPSFRVANKIFATQWDEAHMNVMLDEGGIRTAIHGDPKAFEEVWWGKKLVAVRVDLRRVKAATLRDLLEEAWEMRAPKRLLSD
jgi:hypothetical protein